MPGTVRQRGVPKEVSAMAARGEMGPAKRFFAIRVVPWALVLLGALAIWIGLEDVMRAQASADWPAVDGTITRSTIERISSGGGSGRPRSETHAARIAYEYSVDGNRREGSRVSFGHYDTADEADAARVVKRYPAGTNVKVHYMPGNPGESVLEPGTRGLPWLLLALGIVFGLVGLVLAAVAPRMVAKAP
jgi:hypothetical protein